MVNKYKVPQCIYRDKLQMKTKNEFIRVWNLLGLHGRNMTMRQLINKKRQFARYLPLSEAQRVHLRRQTRERNHNLQLYQTRLELKPFVGGLGENNTFLIASRIHERAETVERFYLSEGLVAYPFVMLLSVRNHLTQEWTAIKGFEMRNAQSIRQLRTHIVRSVNTWNSKIEDREYILGPYDRIHVTISQIKSRQAGCDYKPHVAYIQCQDGITLRCHSVKSKDNNCFINAMLKHLDLSRTMYARRQSSEKAAQIEAHLNRDIRRASCGTSPPT
jgi:hypothetical protein